MSLNNFSSANKDVEKKYLDIRANSVSIGESPCSLSTKTYNPSITSTPQSTVGTIYPAKYTSNGNSLFISGVVDITSSGVPVNQLDLIVTLPVEMIPLFGNSNLYTLFAMGTLTEQDNNTFVNQGLISSSDWVGGAIDLQIMYAKSNTTVTPYRVRYQIQIHRD
jgi:hypothetical protein